MLFHYSAKFKKQYKRLPKKIREQFKHQLEVFLENPRDLRLNIHKLSGKYESLWSMNITGDIRAIFDRSFKDIMLFVAIGTHNKLYL
jgi:addiction module RelE/StbE family toxin